MSRDTRHLDLRALYEATQLLSSSIDLQFVLDNLLLIAMSKMLATRGVVLLQDPLRQHFRVEAVKGSTDLSSDVSFDVELLPESRLLRGDDVPESIRKHKIELLVPIVYQDRTIGWVGLSGKARGEFDPTDMELIKALVSVSSAAVQNSLTIEELRQSTRDLDGKVQELNTLFDLSQEFNSTRDRHRLVRLLSFALMGQLLVKRYLFLLRRPHGETGDSEERMTPVASQGLTQEQVTPELISRLGGIGKAVAPGLSDDGDAWDDLAELGINIAIPLRLRGETEGVLCLGPKMTGKAYEPGDIEFLYALGNLAVTSIQNTYLVEEQIKVERMAEEMRLAREIQERLLPAKLPEFPSLELAAYATPSREVSGDYYDVSMLPGGRLMVAVADVTGKGVPASLLMANLQACLRIILPLDITMEEATSRINDVIHGNTGFDKFITFFWGIVDKEGTKLRYVNAGHNPPVRISSGGELSHLEKGGLLLGIMGSASYEYGEIGLHPGDTIAMFTDGVTEAMNPAGEEYDDPRLEAILVENRNQSATEILNAVLADVADFTQGAEQSDDMTMIVMRVKGDKQASLEE